VCVLSVIKKVKKRKVVSTQFYTSFAPLLNIIIIINDDDDDDDEI
jgi:hypothetical protein